MRRERKQSVRELLAPWCAQMAVSIGYDWFAYRQQYAAARFRQVRNLTDKDYKAMMVTLTREKNAAKARGGA